MNTSVYIFQQRAQVNRWLSLKSRTMHAVNLHKRERFTFCHQSSKRNGDDGAFCPAKIEWSACVANIMVTKSRQACLLSYYVLYQLQRRVMNIFHAPGYCYSARFLTASDTLHTLQLSRYLQFNLTFIISPRAHRRILRSE